MGRLFIVHHALHVQACAHCRSRPGNWTYCYRLHTTIQAWTLHIIIGQDSVTLLFDPLVVKVWPSWCEDKKSKPKQNQMSKQKAQPQICHECHVAFKTHTFATLTLLWYEVRSMIAWWPFMCLLYCVVSCSPPCCCGLHSVFQKSLCGAYATSLPALARNYRDSATIDKQCQ